MTRLRQCARPTQSAARNPASGAFVCVYVCVREREREKRERERQRARERVCVCGCMCVCAGCAWPLQCAARNPASSVCVCVYVCV